MYYIVCLTLFIFFIFILYVLYLRYALYFKLKNKLKILNKEEIAWLKNKKFIKIFNNNFEKSKIIEDNSLNMYLTLFDFNNLRLFANYNKLKIKFNKQNYIFYIPIKKFYD